MKILHFKNQQIEIKFLHNLNGCQRSSSSFERQIKTFYIETKLETELKVEDFKQSFP